MVIERFRSASSGQQAAVIGAVAAVVSLLLLGIWFGFLHTPYKPLFMDMRDDAAATVVAELDRQKTPYRLADDGTSILVPADLVDRTRLSMMSADLPLAGTPGFELFDASEMGVTDFAQRIKFQRALQGELARTIMTLDGIERARVHLSLGEDRVFRKDRIPPSASVTIHMRPGHMLTAGSARGVQRLVAAALPQLDPDTVVILGDRGQLIGPVPGLQVVAAEPYDEPRALELYYRARAWHLIRETGIVGLLAVDVRTEGLVASAQSPGAVRTFSLSVEVRTSAAINPDNRDRISLVLQDGIGLRPDTGDRLEFLVDTMTGSPTTLAPADDQVANAARGPVASNREDRSPVPGFGLLIGIAGSITAAALVLVLRRRNRRMTTVQRRSFAEELESAVLRDVRHV